MLGPVLDLMLDAIDMAATVVVLLALWEGRKGDVRTRLIAWLSGRPVGGAGVDRFLAMARATPRLEAGPSAPDRPDAAERAPGLVDRPAETAHFREPVRPADRGAADGCAGLPGGG